MSELAIQGTSGNLTNEQQRQTPDLKTLAEWEGIGSIAEPIIKSLDSSKGSKERSITFPSPEMSSYKSVHRLISALLQKMASVMNSQIFAAQQTERTKTEEVLRGINKQGTLSGYNATAYGIGGFGAGFLSIIGAIPYFEGIADFTKALAPMVPNASRVANTLLEGKISANKSEESMFHSSVNHKRQATRDMVEQTKDLARKADEASAAAARENAGIFKG